MSLGSSWPADDTRSLPAVTARPRRQPFPRVAWVLAVSAFLCGAMVSAAVFAVSWRHQALRSSSAQTQLAAMTARTHRLAGSLAAAKAATAQASVAARRAHTETASAQAAAQALRQRARTLVAALDSAAGSAATVSGGTSSLGSDLAKLTSELRSLTAYLTSTPAGQLDGGYVATQTAYLTKTIARIGGGQRSLSAAAAAYTAAARAAAVRAAALTRR